MALATVVRLGLGAAAVGSNLVIDDEGNFSARCPAAASKVRS